MATKPVKKTVKKTVKKATRKAPRKTVAKTAGTKRVPTKVAKKKLTATKKAAVAKKTQPTAKRAIQKSSAGLPPGRPEPDLSSLLLRELGKAGHENLSTIAERLFPAVARYVAIEHIAFFSNQGTTPTILDRSGWLNPQEHPEIHTPYTGYKLPDSTAAVHDIPGPEPDRPRRGVFLPISVTDNRIIRILCVYETGTPLKKEIEALSSVLPFMVLAFQTRADRNQIRELEEQNRVSTRDLRQLAEQSERKLKEQREELENVAQKRESELAQTEIALTAESERISTERVAFESSRQDLIDRHNSEVEGLRSELDAERQRLQSEISALNDRIHTERDTAVEYVRSELEQKHAQAIEQAEQRRQREIQEQQKKLSDEGATSLANLRDEMALEIQLRDEEIQKTRDLSATGSRELLQKLEDQKNSYESQLSQLREESQSAAARTNNEHAIAIEGLKKKHADENATSLTARQRELAQLEEKRRADLADLQARHDRETEQLKSAQTQDVQKLDQKISDLNQKADEKAQKVAEEKTRQEEAHRSLVDGLQGELRHRDELLQQQKDRSGKLQESYEQTLQTLEREREEFHRQKGTLNERIARIEEESVLVSEELNATISEREKSLKATQENLSGATEKLTALEKLKQEQISHIETLEKEGRQNEARIADLERTLEKEIEERRAEKERMLSDATEKAATWRNLQEELELRLSERDQEIQHRNESIQKLEQQYGRESQRAHQLENDLAEAHTLHKELSAQIDSLQKGLTEAQTETRELQKLIKAKNDDIRNSHMEEQKLKRSLQAASALQTELESSIEKMKQQLREKDEQNHQKQNEIASLTEKIQSLQKEVENYLGLIQQKKEAIDGLRTEIDQARIQIKHSRKEGHLMAEASRALSHQESFEDKVEYLKEHVLRDITIERVIFYSVDEAENLAPSYSSPSFDFARTRLRLADTFFGQALASQKPVIMNKKAGDEPIDLPRPESLRFIEEDAERFQKFESIYAAAREGAESTIVLPLVLGSHTEGILALTAGQLLSSGKADMTLLEHLLPFVAAAYHDEKERRAVKQLTEAARHLRTVRRFIQKRTADLLLLASDAMPEEDRAGTGIRTRFTARLLNLLEEDTTAADFHPFMDSLETELKETALYPEFHIQADHIARLIGDADASLLLWFVVEAVANAMEHSEGRRLLVESAATGDVATLRIEDDGEGLVRKTGSMNPAGSYGFPFLQATAAILGLELRVTRGEGGLGTSLRLYRR